MAKTAGIVVIGNEILSGKVVDANSPYLCQELRPLGVDVQRVVVLPDAVAVIAEHVAAFASAFDYVLTTGGVGPTHDDVTIEAVARGLDRQVVIQPDLYALLQKHWAERPAAVRDKMVECAGGRAVADGAQPAHSGSAGRQRVRLSGHPEAVPAAVRRHQGALPRVAVSRPPRVRAASERAPSPIIWRP